MSLKAPLPAVKTPRKRFNDDEDLLHSMNRVKTILLALVLLLSQVSIPTASADITDYIDFPYKETVFDSITQYGITYTDSLMLAEWNRVRKGPAPFTGKLTLYFSHNVNIKTYTFQTELISPSGKTILLAGSPTISKTQYSISCWGTYCQSTYWVYEVNIPEGSEVGKYNLRFTAKWLGSNCVGSVCESGITKSQSTTAIGALEITGATPTPTPTSSVSKTSQVITLVAPQDVSIASKINDLTASVTSKLPMDITLNTPSICGFASGNFTLLAAGTCIATLNQRGNELWSPAEPVRIQFEILPETKPVVILAKVIEVSHSWAGWITSYEYISGSNPLNENGLTTIRINGRCTSSGKTIQIWKSTDAKGKVYQNGTKPVMPSMTCKAGSFSGLVSITGATRLYIVELPKSHQGTAIQFKIAQKIGLEKIGS